MTPIPDKEYTFYYEYWATHSDLSASTDEPALPARYQDAVIARSEYYVHQLRSDLQAASLKNQEYSAKINRMRIDLINKPDYMRSTALSSGSRYNTRHPKYF